MTTAEETSSSVLDLGSARAGLMRTFSGRREALSKRVFAQIDRLASSPVGDNNNKQDLSPSPSYRVVAVRARRDSDDVEAERSVPQSPRIVVQRSEEDTFSFEAKTTRLSSNESSPPMMRMSVSAETRVRKISAPMQVTFKDDVKAGGERGELSQAPSLLSVASAGDAAASMIRKLSFRREAISKKLTERMGSTTDGASGSDDDSASSSRAMLMRSLSAKRSEFSKKSSDISRKLTDQLHRSPAMISAVAEKVSKEVKESVKEMKEIAQLIADEAMAGAGANGDEQEEEQLEPAFREALERREIVEKYTKGREGQAIDPWEDPNFSLYAQTDNFGFIHDEPLEGPSVVELKLKAIELKRTKKWLKMYDSWERFSSTLKFRSRVYKGIPDKMRGVVWKKLLNVDGYLLENKDVYAQLLERACLASPEVRQIDADVNRTYRNHVNFRLRFDKGQQSLFHFLAAYSVFNTEVSYCQGMSQVAALLLMYMSDEDAFWALHALMIDDRYGMHGFYVQGFPKLLRFQKHHDQAMKKVVSSVKKHFDKIELVPFLYTTKWFFQCFLDRVPFQLALRLWDIFLLDGDRILTAMALNIMKMHRRILAKCSFEETVSFLQNRLCEDFGYTDDEVIESLRWCLEELRRAKLLVPAEPNEKPTLPCGEILLTPVGEFEMRLREAIEAQRELEARNAARKRSALEAPPSAKRESLHRPSSPSKPAAPTRSIAPVSSPLRHSPAKEVSPMRELRMRQAPSFYDNVPTQYSLVPVDGVASDEELRVRTEWNDEGAQRFTTEYSRTTRSVTTTVVNGVGGKRGALAGDGTHHAEGDVIINRHADNATVVSIADDTHYGISSAIGRRAGVADWSTPEKRTTPQRFPTDFEPVRKGRTPTSPANGGSIGRTNV